MSANQTPDQISNNRYVRDLGKLIAESRINRGLSQARLCEIAVDEHGIEAVSRTTLQRIESGQEGVQLSFHLAVMNVLGIKPSQLFHFLEEEEEEEAETEIIARLNDMAYEQAEVRVADFANQARTVRQKQFAMWARSDIQHNFYSNKETAKKSLIDALALTLPKAIDKTRKEPRLNLKNFDQLTPNKQEYRIYSSLASVNSTQENIMMTKNLLSKLSDNLFMTHTHKIHRCATLFFNITNELLQHHSQGAVLSDEVVVFAQHGLELEKKHHLNKMTPKLYYNLGRYYFYLDDKDKSKAFFQLSYVSWLAMGNQENAKKTLNWVKELYGIELVTL